MHRVGAAAAVFDEAGQTLAVPVRGDGSVHFVGGFYGQWQWKVTDLAHVSVAALQAILRDEVPEGWTEISCHPGYVSDELDSAYRIEREAEVRTLTDPAIARTIAELGIDLASFADFNAQRS